MWNGGFTLIDAWMFRSVRSPDFASAMSGLAGNHFHVPANRYRYLFRVNKFNGEKSKDEHVLDTNSVS